MKRFAALLLALVMALGTASAQEAEMTAQGVTVVRNHVEETATSRLWWIIPRSAAMIPSWNYT